LEIIINKTDKILKGKINLPSSKSISNRVLIIKALMKDDFSVQNLSDADDTVLMEFILNKIEAATGSFKEIRLNCNNAGTVLRFLTAFLAITPGKWFITGSERMKLRPVKTLVDSLKQIGAKINYTKNEGYPPLIIEGRELSSGQIEIDGSISSQFVTALLLIAPVLPKGFSIEIKNKISSFPYIEMTIGLLKYFGIKVNIRKNEISIQNQSFRAKNIIIEPDWTAASYWYEMAAFASDVDITLIGLKNESLQGDAVLPDIYKNFGVKTEFTDEGIRLTKGIKVVEQFEFDFTNYPDLAQAVIVTCAALNIPSKFTGLESLKIKETDRLSALHIELQKLGFDTEIFGDSEIRTENQELRIKNQEPGTMNHEPGTKNPEPGTKNQEPGTRNHEPRTSNQEPRTRNQEPKTINTYGDHRMAMAFAPLALVLNSIRLENPAVVSKSYPGFWEDLKNIGFDI